jgi:3-phenylpropionate/cinnamic acid dioxygenase small subunit
MTAAAAIAQREDVEAFLFREARLLDERRFDEWLSLFTDDCLYWLPMGPQDPDPARDVSLLYDDRQRMGLRIRRLQGKYAFAQEPPSDTCRTLTNLEIRESDDEPGVDLVVMGVTTIFTLRRELAETTVGRCRYHLRRVEDAGDGTAGWRIAYKRVDLLSRNRAIHNLSFIV